MIKIKARNAKYYEYYNTINKTTTKQQKDNKKQRCIHTLIVMKRCSCCPFGVIVVVS